jgi:WD40 repeat protein/serine/threonine protein kinase
MSSRPRNDLSGLDAALARCIDEVCMRFEAAWRAGHEPRIDEYLIQLVDEARPALHAELESLARELLQSAQTMGRAEAGSATGREPLAASSNSEVAEAPTVLLKQPPSSPQAGAAPTGVHAAVTLPRLEETGVDVPTFDSAQVGAAALIPIRRFGDYELIREIARGGMGVVFRARQVSLNRPVALKMILAGRLANDTDVRRFYIEAEAAANLDHPGIVPIYEVGQHDGQHYFSMGFVEGESLSHRLTDGPLPGREAAALMVKVAEAIEYAHQQGVIHRDLKPGNVLVDKNGKPRVTDFGLAKKMQDDSGLTGSGQIMGTPSYMPPEQAGGNRGEVGPAADVYALGATLYALATGRPPFQAATPMDTVLQVISDEPVPPRRLNPAVERDLETICLKCLEKQAAKRYVSAAALGDDLQRFLDGDSIRARSVSTFDKAWRWCRRRPTIAGLTAAVIVAVLGGLAGTTMSWLAALRATDLAEQRLYDSRMNLVQRYWDDYNGYLFRQALDEQLPANQRGIDRRGFEWFYWHRKRSSGSISSLVSAGGIRSVAFSPDCLRLASAGADGTITLADTATGQVVFTVNGHARMVRTVVFCPDGRMIACASSDASVKVWDAVTGQEIRSLSADTRTVAGVAFSPDGRQLASASHDGSLKIWDVGTGRVIRVLGGSAGELTGVAFSPDGRMLASAGADGLVKVWDASTGQETRTLKGHAGRVEGLAFSPDGRQLASVGIDGTKVWNAMTGQEIRALKGHTDGVRSVGFSPDSQRLASGGSDGVVKLWETTTGRETLVVKGDASPVTSVTFTSDGRRLASVSGVTNQRGAGSVRTVKMWDAETGQETLTFSGHTGSVTSLAFSPDGHWLASASVRSTKAAEVKIWDAETGQETLTLKGHTGPVYSLAYSPDGGRLASAGGESSKPGEVKLWDTTTGLKTHTLEGGHTRIVKSVAFSPDGQWLASAGADGTIKLWDTATGQQNRSLNVRGSLVTAILSSDGQRLAASSEFGSVEVWDTATGHLTLGVFNRSRAITSLAFSPNGQRLAFADQDRTVRVWDTGRGQEILTIKGHTNDVRSVAFSPDGQRIASGSDDGSVKVSDTATGEEVLTLKEHTGSVRSVAFSPCGRRLASASDDGTVKVWDATSITPESQDRDDALSVVRFLLERVTSEAELRDRIMGDKAISDSTRAAALKMAGGFWLQRVRRKATL